MIFLLFSGIAEALIEKCKSIEYQSKKIKAGVHCIDRNDPKILNCLSFFSNMNDY